MVKVLFILRTHGCWKNAVETCPAGVCGAGQELFAGQRGVAQCVTVSAAAFRGCKKEGA